MPSSAPRILVVYKKSQLELYVEHEPAFIDRFKQREPELWSRFEVAHELNVQAIDAVRRAIRERGLEAWFVYRADHDSAEGFDLIVSVGGDGTFLDVSHSIRHRPVLGVNSLPASSVGHFCSTDAGGFGDALDAWRAGEADVVALHRLRISLDGCPLPIPVLNEVLYAHPSPAAMNRYALQVGGVEEEQMSSGVWISTAAGSTGSILSAGGQRMTVGDRRIQYLVREPFAGNGRYELVSGIVDSAIELRSKMRTSRLYIDGHREERPVTLGDRIRIDRHPNDLHVVSIRKDRPGGVEIRGCAGRGIGEP